jgi:Carboxypeptidase regulatory-like domain/TonB dependent receptor
MKRLLLLLCAMAALLTSSLLFGQNPSGAMRGTVQDATGARVPGAAISIKARGSALTRTANTDSRGEFRVVSLPPDTYLVAVNGKGFADASTEIKVEIGIVRDLVVTLRPKSANTEIAVKGSASSITTQPLHTSSAVHEGVVTAQDLDEVPLAHRSFANIAYLVPGTAPVEPSDPTKARITAVSFGGSSGLNVELSVDGGDNSDDYIGGFLQNLSPDAVQEFAVRTSQEDAESGETVGGSVVISTRRGTNDWHGTGAFYERGSALNARYPLDNPDPDPKQPFSRQNYVATLGGPLKRDKFWFFSSLEAVHENASIAYSPSSQAEFQGLSSLASQGLIPGVSAIDAPKNTPVPFRDYLGMVRLDYTQSEKSQWFFRAAIDNYTTNNDLVQQATLASTGATSGSKYDNFLLSNQHVFNPTWVGALTFDASLLHHTVSRNSDYGFGLAFPFSSTFRTITGFETFGDNQFATEITAFPVVRDQQKYQFRYDLTHTTGRHAPKFGINFVHEPVLSGSLAGTAETLLSYPEDPRFYAANPLQFYFDTSCTNAPADVECTATPAGDMRFSQNVQRLGLYAQDSWRATSKLTVNYGVRYETTFGLLDASGKSQAQNPAYQTLRALNIPLSNGVPHDYRGAIAPRLGLAYGVNQSTVIRAGIGMYYNDLAQNGWVPALQAVNLPSAPCTAPGDAGCLTAGSPGALIDSHYKTPYALHASAGIEHSFGENWLLSADWTHEQGVHAYRGYNFVAGDSLFSPDPANQGLVPDVTLYKTDNRSRYDGMSIRLQGNTTRFNLQAHYTLASAKTWGCTVGELFDYVNGVCNPLNPFGPGDYGPAGEDIRHRFVLAGMLKAPFGFELTTLTQVESARPFTIATPATGNRAVINGQETTLDQFRGTPYIQVDMRVGRPFSISDRVKVNPFVEFFNLLNRNNPGNNYVGDISALPTPVNDVANATAFCLNADCSLTQPITNLNQLKMPAGALGDFFGPGTTVGIPFAAQVAVRVTF